MSDVKVCRVCDIADCHHIREANTGVTVSEDGKITVDIAQADAMWQGLDPLARAEFTNMIFEPVLKSATEAKGTIADLTAERDDALARVAELEAVLQGIVNLGGTMGSALYAETVDRAARRALQSEERNND